MREKIAEGYRIPWWAHRDDVHGRGSSSFALFPKHIGSVDPDALKIPRPKGGYYSLTESAPAPFHAEPAHSRTACRNPRCQPQRYQEEQGLPRSVLAKVPGYP